MPGPDCGEAPPRIVIDDVTPTVGCGRHPVKRSVGDVVQATAVAFTHGHDVVGAAVRYRRRGVRRWSEREMTPVATEPDRFAADFDVTECGRWEFRVVAWVDPIATWREELRRRVEAGQTDLAEELAYGARLMGVESLDVDLVLSSDAPPSAATAARHATTVGPAFEIDVDPALARFGSWYELFPRSFGGLAGVEAQLPRLAELGFDVVYLTPIHPIGLTDRKGPDNTLNAPPGAPGSPWAIGGCDGGHTAIHPELGTIADFDRLVARAQELGLAIALDFAVQCSPDHPWLREHPEWFSWLPDGTVRHAENPPKRYQDIVNLDFDSADWRGLWAALLDVVMFWVGHGVRVFRVDNPHTKPVAFWEWLIKEVRSAHPDVIFLSEAFTRPTMMRHLAKIGFNQSYTYFTWRNTRAELEEYVTELAGEDVGVLPAQLLREHPGHPPRVPPARRPRRLRGAARPRGDALSVVRHLLRVRVVREHAAARAGSEEYLGSEKYEVRPRALDGPLLPLVARPQRDPPVVRAVPADRQRALPRIPQRPVTRVREAGGPTHRDHVREPRSVRVRGGRGRSPRIARHRPHLRGHRPADGHAIRVADGWQLRHARPGPSPRHEGPMTETVYAARETLAEIRQEIATSEQQSHSSQWFESDPNWFKTAVFYEVHIRGFADGNDDGIGDFVGLTERLDYLRWLGVDCIWLLPMYASPLRDGGYDISDFYSIHPDYGTVDDMRTFVDAAHQRGIRVIADLVMNHTSIDHPWFQEARSSPDNPKRDWYVWSPTDDRYSDARVIFVDAEASNWTWDPVAGAYYWHRFFSHQPDLNYDNPEVREEMISVLNFWLDTGPRRVPARRRAVPVRTRRHELREPARDARVPQSAARPGRRQVSRPGAPRRGEPMARRRRRVLRRRRRMPHGVPFPA